MQNRPKLSLCLIAKDEEQFINRCLKSVGGLASEIILLDTGSQDQTINIAKEYGAKIFCIPWPGDFSKARNIAQSHATGQWILILDADEELDCESKAVVEQLIQGEHVCYYVNRRHYFLGVDDTSGKVGFHKTQHGDEYSYLQETRDLRLFPNDPKIQFSGRLHEGIEESAWGQGYKTLESSIVVHHYGPLKSKSEQANKLAHYLELSRLKWEESFGSWKAAIEYAQALQESGQSAEGLKLLIGLSSTEPSSPEFWYFLGKMQSAVSEHENAIASFAKAIELGPTYYPSYFGLGSSLLQIGHFDDAAACLAEAVRLDPANPNIWVALGMSQNKRGKTEEANRCFDECLRLVPGFPAALTAKKGTDPI